MVGILVINNHDVMEVLHVLTTILSCILYDIVMFILIFICAWKNTNVLYVKLILYIMKTRNNLLGSGFPIDIIHKIL